jgi:large subunit ribosomal protein L15
MQTHNVKSKTKRAVARRVGRGGKRGKTAGRGTKGQNARSGRKKRPEMRDIIKKLPKRRGRGKQGLRTIQAPFAPIALADIAAAFKAGETVSPKSLAERAMISLRGGKYPKVKVLAGGEIAVAVTVEGCAVSSAAKSAIEKAGGSVRANA